MRSWLAVGSLLLVAGSWRLWTPQTVFPRVPLFSVLVDWPEPLDELVTWSLLGLWLGATATLAWPRLGRSPATASSLSDAGAVHTRPLQTRWSESSAIWLTVIYVLSLSGLVALDQHRLQPWAVHVALCLLIVVTFEGRQKLSWLLALTASIYIYSALSKFDAQFLHTVGQDFLAGLLRIWPGSYASLAEPWPVVLAAAFPMGELVCGLGLLWQRSQRVALVLAILMHLTLIALLGPWGLGHSWGVLLWNVVFIGMDYLLLVQLKALRASDGMSFQWFRWTHRPAGGIVWRGVVYAGLGVMLCLPLGERWGVVDHWLGWALYAPHSSRARIEVLADSLENAPTKLKQLLNPNRDLIAETNSPWATVAVERWSLETLGVPIYPQQRFYVAIARAVATQTDQYAIRVTLLGTAKRWSGQREYRVLTSLQELETAGEQYWFNTRPRW